VKNEKTHYLIRGFEAFAIGFSKLRFRRKIGNNITHSNIPLTQIMTFVDNDFLHLEGSIAFNTL
jgi:hypothetical protein